MPLAAGVHARLGHAKRIDQEARRDRCVPEGCWRTLADTIRPRTDTGARDRLHR